MSLTLDPAWLNLIQHREPDHHYALIAWTVAVLLICVFFRGVSK